MAARQQADRPADRQQAGWQADRQQADLLLIHASELITCAVPDGMVPVRDPDLPLEVIADGAVAIQDGRIVDVGTTAELQSRWSAAEVADCSGQLVTPGLIDAHAHPVHASSRHREYEAFLGGDLAVSSAAYYLTAAESAAADDDTLRALLDARLDEFLRLGTTTIEAKTGYGHTPEAELRHLALLAEAARADGAIGIVPTFMPLHRRPPETDPADDARTVDAYLSAMVAALPEAAKLADYCDVCCDPRCFTEAECRRVAEAALELGMGIRVHGDQNGWVGGVRFAVDIGAASIDHIDFLRPEDAAALGATDTVAVLTPTLLIHRESGVLADNVPDARPGRQTPRRLGELVTAEGVAVALSADYNPGSSPTFSLQLTMQAAARFYRFGFDRIWYQVTVNPAYSLGRWHDRGSIEVGKRADLVAWRVPERGMVLDQFGHNLVDRVWTGGKLRVSHAGAMVGG